VLKSKQSLLSVSFLYMVNTKHNNVVHHGITDVIFGHFQKSLDLLSSFFSNFLTISVLQSIFSFFCIPLFVTVAMNTSLQSSAFLLF